MNLNLTNGRHAPLARLSRYPELAILYTLLRWTSSNLSVSILCFVAGLLKSSGNTFGYSERSSSCFSLQHLSRPLSAAVVSICLLSYHIESGCGSAAQVATAGCGNSSEAVLLST